MPRLSVPLRYRPRHCQTEGSPLTVLGCIAILWIGLAVLISSSGCASMPTCASLAKLPADATVRPVWGPNPDGKSPQYVVVAVEAQGATVRLNPPAMNCR